MPRKQKIVRTPITKELLGVVFQTIAASTDKYENATVINEYPTIEAARKHYTEDMSVYSKENGSMGRHYAIRKVVKEECV